MSAQIIKFPVVVSSNHETQIEVVEDEKIFIELLAELSENEKSKILQIMQSMAARKA